MGGHTTEGRGDTQAVSGRQLVLLVVVAGSRRGIQRAPGHAEHPGTGPPSRCRCGGAAMKAPPTQHTHAAVGHEDEQLIAGDERGATDRGRGGCDADVVEVLDSSGNCLRADSAYDLPLSVNYLVNVSELSG
jgi:hypothetical protein